MISADIKTRPLEVVRNLVKESIESEEALTILSLLQEKPSGRLAITNAIEEIVKSRGVNLFTLTRDKIEPIASKSEDLTKRFKRRDIDKKIFTEYKVSDTWALGTALMNRILLLGEHAAREEFSQILDPILSVTPEITQEERDLVEDVLFRRVYSIGVAAA